MKRILMGTFGPENAYTVFFVAGGDYIVTDESGLAWTDATEELATPDGLSDGDLIAAKASLAEARRIVAAGVGLPATAMGEEARKFAIAWAWATEDDFDGDDIIPPYGGWRVKYGFLAEDLWNEPPENCGIDEKASVRRYAQLCREALEEAYPGAVVEVDWQDNTSGALPATLKPLVSIPDDGEDLDRCETERFEAEAVDNICGKVFEGGAWYVDLHYGAKEFAAALGYVGRKGSAAFGARRGRGLLPAPAFEIASGPVWTHSQVEKFKAERASVSTGGRPIDSAYDRDFIAATEKLIEDLRKAGHEVETPVTGAVIVDGIEIPADSWDGVAVAYGQERDIDTAWDYIQERFGAVE